MSSNEFTSVQSFGYTDFLKKLRSRKDVIESHTVHDKMDLRADILENPQDDTDTLVTASAMFMDTVHFNLTYTPLEHLGRKIITASASRLAAMNVQPFVLSVSFAIPNMISVEMIERICSGLEEGCRVCKCTLRISDVTAARENLTVSVQAIAAANREKLVAKGECRPGDQICVTGDLGGAMAGLRILLREKRAWQESENEFFQPDLQNYEYVVGRQLLPIARFDLLEAFDRSEILPTSMIDVSLGLLNELQQISGIGRVGYEVFLPAIPISLETREVADEMKEDVDRYACYGGEDYELLFTLRSPDVERLKSEFEDFSVIGEVRSENEGIKLNTGE